MIRVAPFLCLAFVVFAARPAAAHEIHAFVYAEGTTLHGEVHAHGGETIRDAKVTVFDSAARATPLGETVTDDGGKFTFEARYRCDHRFVVDAGAGHTAEYTLAADELPDGLPAHDASVASPGKAHAESHHHHHADGADHVHHNTSHDDPVSLARQIVQLRRQLDDYQHKLWLRDILGAIGYIVGAMGLVYYFRGAKREVRGER